MSRYRLTPEEETRMKSAYQRREDTAKAGWDQPNTHSRAGQETDIRNENCRENSKEPTGGSSRFSVFILAGIVLGMILMAYGLSWWIGGQRNRREPSDHRAFVVPEDVFLRMERQTAMSPDQIERFRPLYQRFYSETVETEGMRDYLKAGLSGIEGSRDLSEKNGLDNYFERREQKLCSAKNYRDSFLGFLDPEQVLKVFLIHEKLPENTTE